MATQEDNVAALRACIRPCRLCAQDCRVDRTAGEVGACGIGAEAVVASAGPHFGEEPPLVGRGGSGTIFFAGCNLHCVFCQNYDISRSSTGRKVSAKQLANIALSLEDQGCENVNFVTPSHVAHAVAEAVLLARGSGLSVPIVYNCGGYDALETLRRLEGLVEIYMPDFKYADAEAGRLFSGVEDYPQAARKALEEMYRQVGPLQVNEAGVATRGVLVRHLVMPKDVARSREVIETVARVAPGCAINVMGQYHPAYRSGEFEQLSAAVEQRGVSELRNYAASLGLVRADRWM